MKIIKRKFYQRPPDEVARDLLGKLLIKRDEGKILAGRIVETEAYFDEHDPASRAAVSKKWLAKMLREPGRTFIYPVHKYWMLNIVAHEMGKAGAVLIRALEPLTEMSGKTNGPGKLTKVFGIDKKFDNIPVHSKESPLIISLPRKDEEFAIARAFRIGIKKDLPQPMRFYIKGNRFVSRK